MGKFIFIDQSGRGEVCENLSIKDILDLACEDFIDIDQVEDEEEFYNDTLQGWLLTAGKGSEWHDASYKVICIESAELESALV